MHNWFVAYTTHFAAFCNKHSSFCSSVRIFITSAMSAKCLPFGKKQNGGYVQPPILARPHSLRPLFVPMDEAGLETEAFCWYCKGSARISGSP